MSARVLCQTLTVSVNSQQGSSSRKVVTEAAAGGATAGGPPVSPQILLLSDQMLEQFVRPDKYIKCLAMKDYDWKQFARDIEDDLIDVDLPHCVVFLGAMQLGIYEPRAAHSDIGKLVQLMVERNPGINVVITGLVPRLVDYNHSRKRCEFMNSSLRLITKDLELKVKPATVQYMDPFYEFLNLDGTVKNVEQKFINGVFLSTGICVLRAAWLRHLGYFPKK